jgi:hypothetical protein
MSVAPHGSLIIRLFSYNNSHIIPVKRPSTPPTAKLVRHGSLCSYRNLELVWGACGTRDADVKADRRGA